MLPKVNHQTEAHAELIKAICQVYRLGNCLSPVEYLLGGLVHDTFHLTTTTGQYAIKILNPAWVNTLEKINRLRITECIAAKLKHYVPTVNAVSINNDPLFFFQKSNILVFPYIQAKTLNQSTISATHINKIAALLAQIHQVDIKLQDAPKTEFISLTFLNKADSYHNLAIKSAELMSQVENLRGYIDAIYQHILIFESTLLQNSVISHRDCDPKNVLWDNENNFYLIDWESAGYINRTKDCLVTAIYWSLEKNYQVNHLKLLSFLAAYQEVYQNIRVDEIEAGLYGLLGDWLSWLDFNLSRVIHQPVNSTEFFRGNIEAKNTLFALPILSKQIPELIKLLENSSIC